MDVLPRDNAGYGQRDYWEQRFAVEAEYDWLASWEELRPLLQPHLQRDEVVLVLGCGNSGLSAGVWSSGCCASVTSIDWSRTVIDRQRQRHSRQQGLTCPLLTHTHALATSIGITVCFPTPSPTHCRSPFSLSVCCVQGW